MGRTGSVFCVIFLAILFSDVIVIGQNQPNSDNSDSAKSTDNNLPGGSTNGTTPEPGWLDWLWEEEENKAPENDPNGDNSQTPPPGQPAGNPGNIPGGYPNLPPGYEIPEGYPMPGNIPEGYPIPDNIPKEYLEKYGLAGRPKVKTTPKPKGEIPKLNFSKNPSFRDDIDCHLYPHDPEFYKVVNKAIDGGAALIKYHIKFLEYERKEMGNPLQDDMTYSFKADHWQRVVTKHGKPLVGMAFNYDILSLSLLNFSVESLSVNVVDTPPSCFRTLDETDRIEVMMKLVMADFHVSTDFYGMTVISKNPRPEEELEDAMVCHQIVKEEDGVADFPHRCCSIKKDLKQVVCTDDLGHDWVEALTYIVITLKIILIMFGPLVLITWLYTDAIGKCDYTVKLSDTLCKTMLLRKVKHSDDDANPFRKQKGSKQFKAFRSICKYFPADEIVPVSFNKLQVLVDHRELMSEHNVPVGLFRYIYQMFFKCRIRQYEPFLSCCQESIFGSWSPRFLWLKLTQRFECNVSCRKCISWGHLCRFIGALLLVAIAPLPYYIRVVIYYLWEEEEIVERKNKIEYLDLTEGRQHSFVHYFEPKHGTMILIYVVYLLSVLLLGMLRICKRDKFDKIIHDAIEDLKKVSRLECFRLIMAHMVLPFEKFGICGLFVGILYWPIMLPVCILTALFYCMPTLYLTGRFIVQGRPTVCRSLPCPTSPKLRPKNTRTLSNGTSSFETCLLLENINPNLRQWESRKEHVTFSAMLQRCFIGVMGSAIGLLCVLFMYSLLLLYAEAFGFVIEVVFFTVIGAFFNAGDAIIYVLLAFWLLLYAACCYCYAHRRYVQLAKKVFEMIQVKLTDNIAKVSRLREGKFKGTAFKYFTLTELTELRQLEQDCEDEDDDSNNDDAVRLQTARVVIEQQKSEDSIEYIGGKLHWRINNLIFFVDRNDVPRIPKELFHEICAVEAPGCPGPAHKSLLQATRHFLYMATFMALIMIAVVVLRDYYDVTTIHQLLVVVAAGFIPFLVRHLVMPKVEDVDLNNYTFRGKIHHVISEFSQAWPIFDLTFKKTELTRDTPNGAPGMPHSDSRGPIANTPDANSGEVRNGDFQSHNHLDQTHVDLLITIRDDAEDRFMENLNADPNSLASHGSLNSVPPPNPQAIEDHEGAQASALPSRLYQASRSKQGSFYSFKSGSQSDPEAMELAPLRGRSESDAPPDRNIQAQITPDVRNVCSPPVQTVTNNPTRPYTHVRHASEGQSHVWQKQQNVPAAAALSSPSSPNRPPDDTTDVNPPEVKVKNSNPHNESKNANDDKEINAKKA